ncbi:MAG: DUF5671 domain-containing protein [Candidatus Spechtbacterales bacterium]
MNNKDSQKMDSSPQVPSGTGPRDVFFQLLAMITLYMSAISFGTLLFQYINIYFPDPLTNYGSYSPARGALRFSLAMLVIVFPIFVWVSRVLKREVREVPEKGEMRVRKWLLSFTLFAAALLIIGDLIALVNRYLSGDLTVQFLLKVAVILLIAGLIFRYYLWQLRERGGADNSAMKWMEQAVIAIVGITVVAGFVLAGSPQSERLRRFDERKVNDLSSIQWQVVSFWQDKDRLPNDLSELKDSISGYSAPLDPQTGEMYEYSVLGELEFELCATFNSESSSNVGVYERYPTKLIPGREEFDNWAHGAGRVCFEREIDPELYSKDTSGIREIPL